MRNSSSVLAVKSLKNRTNKKTNKQTKTFLRGIRGPFTVADLPVTDNIAYHCLCIIAGSMQLNSTLAKRFLNKQIKICRCMPKNL